MRFTQLTGLSLVAAMTFLAGYSGSGNTGSGVTPIGSQSHASTQALGGARPVLKMSNVTPDKGADCSEFSEGCIAISASAPASLEWCLSSSGNCSSGLVGDPTWTFTLTNLKGKPVKLGKKINASWAPNPGNPSILTVTTNSTKSSPKIKYILELSACTSSQCFSDFASYGVEI